MITAVVGSGGKTTLIHRLAQQYRQAGKRVLVTTTTHMWLEEGAVLSGNPDDIAVQLERTGYAMAGTQEGEKLASLPAGVYEEVCRYADEVLVEADGSKGLPVKFPAAWEPVIPANAEEIIVVCNLAGMGRTIAETVHRPQLAADCLEIPPDTVLTAAHVQTLLRAGYLGPLREKFPGKRVRLRVNHDGSPYQRGVASLLELDQDAAPAGLESVLAKYRLGCVVMAAGKGRRFGGQKLLAPLGGVPLLTRTLEGIPRGLFARVTVVVSDSEVAALCAAKGVDVVSYPGGPQSESVRRGVAAMAGLDGCLFLPGDQPLCRSFGALAAAFTPELPVRLAHEGKPGSPVLVPAMYFSRLAALSGDVGGASLVKNASVRLVEGNFEELLDADTPEALQTLEKMLGWKDRLS